MFLSQWEGASFLHSPKEKTSKPRTQFMCLIGNLKLWPVISLHLQLRFFGPLAKMREHMSGTNKRHSGKHGNLKMRKYDLSQWDPPSSVVYFGETLLEPSLHPTFNLWLKIKELELRRCWILPRGIPSICVFVP